MAAKHFFVSQPLILCIKILFVNLQSAQNEARVTVFVYPIHKKRRLYKRKGDIAPSLCLLHLNHFSSPFILSISSGSSATVSMI